MAIPPYPILLSLLVRLPSCLFMGRASKDNSGAAKSLTFPTGSPWPAWPWASWPPGTCVQGLVGSPWDFRKLLGVSGFHHARLCEDIQCCPRGGISLPRHVSAFLNLSRANQRPSSAWRLNPRVRRVSEAGLTEAGFCPACLHGAVWEQ